MDSRSSDHSPSLSENTGGSWIRNWENEVSSVSALNLENSSELNGLVEDKEIAARAVAFVVSSTRKGIIPLCADVASILRAKQNLENKVLLLKHENEVLRTSLNSSMQTSPTPPQSSYGGSHHHHHHHHHRQRDKDVFIQREHCSRCSPCSSPRINSPKFDTIHHPVKAAHNALTSRPPIHPKSTSDMYNNLPPRSPVPDTIITQAIVHAAPLESMELNETTVRAVDSSHKKKRRKNSLPEIVSEPNGDLPKISPLSVKVMQETQCSLQTPPHSPDSQLEADVKETVKLNRLLAEDLDCAKQEIVELKGRLKELELNQYSMSLDRRKTFPLPHNLVGMKASSVDPPQISEPQRIHRHSLDTEWIDGVTYFQNTDKNSGKFIHQETLTHINNNNIINNNNHQIEKEQENYSKLFNNSPSNMLITSPSNKSNSQMSRTSNTPMSPPSNSQMSHTSNTPMSPPSNSQMGRTSNTPMSPPSNSQMRPPSNLSTNPPSNMSPQSEGTHAENLINERKFMISPSEDADKHEKFVHRRDVPPLQAHVPAVVHQQDSSIASAPVQFTSRVRLRTQPIQKPTPINATHSNSVSGQTMVSVETVSPQVSPLRPQPLRQACETSTRALPNILAGCLCSSCENDEVFHRPIPTSSRKYLVRDQLEVQLNDHVIVKGERTGHIRYIGHLDKVGQPNLVFVGLELDVPVGRHDGSFNGKRYFSCHSNHGIFVPLQDIKCLIQNHSADTTVIDVRSLSEERNSSANSSRQSPESGYVTHRRSLILNIDTVSPDREITV